MSKNKKSYYKTTLPTKDSHHATIFPNINSHHNPPANSHCYLVPHHWFTLEMDLAEPKVELVDDQLSHVGKNLWKNLIRTPKLVIYSTQPINLSGTLIRLGLNFKPMLGGFFICYTFWLWVFQMQWTLATHGIYLTVSVIKQVIVDTLCCILYCICNATHM